MATILQLANADQSLLTFMKTLKLTGLEEMLAGYGPFTILAPINLAFSNLEKNAWENIQKPANKLKLEDMLSCCILKEKKLFRDFSNGQKLKTIGGHELLVSVQYDEVTIDGAKILSRDRQGSNGVVHSINTTHLPA